MNNMIDRPRKLVWLAVIIAGTLPAAAANAHCCRSSNAEPVPFYPYVAPEVEFYAVELAPNVYAVLYETRAYPYVRCLDGCGRRAPIAQWHRRGHVQSRGHQHHQNCARSAGRDRNRARGRRSAARDRARACG